MQTLDDLTKSAARPERDPLRSPVAEPSMRSGTSVTFSANKDWRDRIVLDTLARIVRHRVLAVAMVGVCTTAAGLNTLRHDKYYVATATIFPAASASPMAALGLGGIANLVGGLGGAGGGSSQFPIYENVVHSEHLLTQLVDTPVPGARTLLEHLKIEEDDRALQRIIAMSVVRDNIAYDTDKKTGLVLISYTDRDPAVAAAVANRVLQLLNEFDVSTSTGQARERRQFVEARLEEAHRSLQQAEQRFEVFSQENLRIGRAPDLLLEQARLEREVTIEQEVYLALRKEAEMARIDEQRALPAVNVLDQATPPPVPAGPSLVRSVVFGFALGTVLVVVVFAVQALSPRRWWRKVAALGDA